MTKILIEIQGNLYDLWEFRTLERGERYNGEKECLEYLLVVNRQSISTNYTDVEFAYETEELRNFEYNNIMQQFEFFEGVVLVRAGADLDTLKNKLAELTNKVKE